MRFSLPILLCAILAELHYGGNGETFLGARSQLGKTLIKRVRQIVQKPQGDAEESDIPEEERERVQELDAAEDIFVGSGNHPNESQGRSETSGSKRKETSEGKGNESREEEDSSITGDGDEGGEKKDGMEDDNDEDDDDDDEKEELDDEDEDNDPASVSKPQEEGTTGLGLTQNENTERRSFESSGVGIGSGITFENEQLSDDNFDQSGLGESTIQELLPTNASAVDEANRSDDNEVMASGSEDESAAKKSAVKINKSGDNEDTKGEEDEEEEEEDSGSAEVIRKGIESLSRLLTPVASGYEFELYSGNAAKESKKENANKAEFEGESETGYRPSKTQVHVKKCKRVCKDPMTYKQCAVPRCDYKLGTIKDLCIWLCKHQTPVCSQECV